MTRRERYLLRRAKYLRRARRAERSGYTWGIGPGTLVPYPTQQRTGRKHRLTSPGKQHVQDVSSKSYEAVLDPASAFFPPITFSQSDAGRGKPPHVAFVGFWRTFTDTRIPHMRFSQIGFHRRRVLYYGHRPWRMNGFERKCWGAAKNAYFEGWFPDWDPLGRHPTLDEVDGGADPYSGPFPQTPRV